MRRFGSGAEATRERRWSTEVVDHAGIDQDAEAAHRERRSNRVGDVARGRRRGGRERLGPIDIHDPGALWLDHGAAVVGLVVGLIGWASSAAMIVTKVPKGELITGGPYAIVKHPLYTSVGLLVLPAAGVLLDTWLGAALGATIYLASRRFAPAEEAALAESFGRRWDAYARRVIVPWL
jgi:hypothetical protein